MRFSKDNVAELTADSGDEVAEEMYESFDEGDIEAAVTWWDSAIELRESEGMVGGGTFHGPDEITSSSSMTGRRPEDVVRRHRPVRCGL